MINSDQVRQILQTVIDPELGHNIVDLGLIYDIKISSDNPDDQPQITILMTLTTPGCPLSGYFSDTIKSTVASAANIDPNQVIIDLTFDPPWSPEAMSEAIRLELGL